MLCRCRKDTRSITRATMRIVRLLAAHGCRVSTVLAFLKSRARRISSLLARFGGRRLSRTLMLRRIQEGVGATSEDQNVGRV
eukprot:7357184-Alexandrium_andersonii.AAC.1